MDMIQIFLYQKSQEEKNKLLCRDIQLNTVRFNNKDHDVYTVF